jgi:hypothetical protein
MSDAAGLQSALLRILLVVALGRAAGGCAGANPVLVAGPRLVITPEQLGQTVVARLGQQVVLRRPVDVPRWTLDFDPAILKPLMGTERIRMPGPEGWLFKAVGLGRSEVVATSVSACSPDEPCPPPVRFSVTVEVKKTQTSKRRSRAATGGYAAALPLSLSLRE